MYWKYLGDALLPFLTSKEVQLSTPEEINALETKYIQSYILPLNRTIKTAQA
jgi:hypothetical protein